MSDDKREALKTLFEGHQRALTTLSARSFSTTLQAIGFDVAVVAGLVVGGVRLTGNQKNVAVAYLLAFTGLVAWYLISKSIAHHRERKKFDTVEVMLSELAGIVSKPKKRSWLVGFVGGSGIFALLVILAGLGAVWWIATQS